jgi:hypothetical protein
MTADARAAGPREAQAAGGERMMNSIGQAQTPACHRRAFSRPARRCVARATPRSGTHPTRRSWPSISVAPVCTRGDGDLVRRRSNAAKVFTPFPRSTNTCSAWSPKWLDQAPGDRGLDHYDYWIIFQVPRLHAADAYLVVLQQSDHLTLDEFGMADWRFGCRLASAPPGARCGGCRAGVHRRTHDLLQPRVAASPITLSSGPT